MKNCFLSVAFAALPYMGLSADVTLAPDAVRDRTGRTNRLIFATIWV